MTPMAFDEELELLTAERKAYHALSRYKFWMFGYYAARWVYINRAFGMGRSSPFKLLVTYARQRLERMR